MGRLYTEGNFLEFSMYYRDEIAQEIGVDSPDEHIYDGTYEFHINPKDNINIVLVEYKDVYDRVRTAPIVDNRVVFDYEISGNGYIWITTENTAPDRDVSGFNKLYAVTNDILNMVASERWVYSGTDLGDYMLNLLELPFKLDESLYGIENPIRLGEYTLDTKAPELMKDRIIIDLGTIHVPEKYQNSFDYMNTIVKLHLPYTNSIDLDVQYVVNATISIQYILDLYSGDCTVNIHSDKINQIIHSEQIKIGRDIPFIRKLSGNVTNSLSSFNGIYNDVTTPFIEVIRNKLLEGEFNNFVTVNDMISNVHGYVEVSNILLETDATSNEKDTIINLLSSGVYIK